MPMYDPVHDVVVDNQDVVKPEETEPEPEAVNVEVRSNSSSSSTNPTTANITTHTDLNEEVAAKPVILKHKLNENNKLTPSKKKQKTLVGPIGKSQNILSSARSRHLKKNDGEPFWRKDIQFELLKALFDDKTKAFTDPHVDSIDDVNMKDRPKDEIHKKLSFAELYIKTIAHSPKCSKILKDRLLNEMQMSIPTCMICLLVNVGRMNTTINFVPDMKSQLRTYHSIPSLQVNYSDKQHDNKNDKQLQDTPRLKSILKACCDEESEPNGLPALENIRDKIPKTNIINLIFILCNAEESVNTRFFEKTEYKFYDLFLNPRFNPYERSKLFLWLIFNYLETDLTNEQISKNPYGSKIISLSQVEEANFDIDTEEELALGKSLLDQRTKFLKDDNDLYGNEDDKKSSPLKGKTGTKPKDNQEDSNLSSTATTSLEPPTTANHDTIESNTMTLRESSTQPVAPSAPIMRQDIDVDKVLKFVKTFRSQNEKKRTKKGLLKHEHSRLLKELQGPEDLTRPRLKNYKGDFGEYTSKMTKIFKKVKDDFIGSFTKIKKDQIDPSFSYSNDDDLTLKEFSI